MDLDAYVAPDFDARRHVHRLLQNASPHHQRGGGGGGGQGRKTIEGWTRTLEGWQERAVRQRETAWDDLRTRLPRAAKEAQRVAHAADVHALPRRKQPPQQQQERDGPARGLRRAARRSARVKRVLRTLDAVQLLLVHDGEEEEVEQDVAGWMRSTDRARALRRALRATEDVRGYEAARGRAAKHVEARLRRGAELAKRAAAARRDADVRRLLRGARACGGESVVRAAVVRVLGARVARRVVHAYDDDEEGGGGGGEADAHVRAWEAWTTACAEEREAWKDPAWWRDVATHAWEEAARARAGMDRPDPAHAPCDVMRGRRDALARATRSLLPVEDGRRPLCRELSESEEDIEEEEGASEGEGREDGRPPRADREALVWTVSSPWRRTASAWRTAAWTDWSRGTETDRGEEGSQEDPRGSARTTGDLWIRWATAWWRGAKERCACATDLADAEGLAQMAHRSACELAQRQAEAAEAWTDRRKYDDGGGDGRGDAAELLRMAVRACACACDVRKKCARALASAPVLDGDATLVREDGTLDLARLWRRAAAEDPDGATIPGASGPATAEDAERRLADALRATEAAFVAAAGQSAVTRLSDACAAPYRERDGRGRDDPDASRDPRGRVEKGTRGGWDVSFPTFSASPQECVASAGEDLLRVPERIAEVDACVGHYREVKAILRAAEEDAEEEGDADDGEEMDETERKLLPWLAEAMSGIDPATRADEGEGGVLVASWSARVARHVAQKYAEALLQGIRSLDAEGEAQLQADLEYFLNVIAALAAEAPSSLVTLRDCVSMGPERLQELAHTTPASDDARGMPVDRDAVRVLLRAKRRGLPSVP